MKETIVDTGIYKRRSFIVETGEDVEKLIAEWNSRPTALLEVELEANRVLAEHKPDTPIYNDAKHLLSLLWSLKLCRKAARDCDAILINIGRFRERLYGRQFEAEVLTRRKQREGRVKHARAVNAARAERHNKVIQYWLVLRREELLATKADRETANRFGYKDEKTVRRITKNYRNNTF